MNVEVVTVANAKPTADYYLFDEWGASLDKFGVKPVILGWQQPWHGLMTKPRRLQEWLRSGAADNVDCIIVVDCFDLVFAHHPRDIAMLWKACGGVWTIGGERSLFPSGNEDAYQKGTSSYRFPNSGFIISTPQDMEKVLGAMDLPNIKDDHVDDTGRSIHPNDQEEYQRMFLRQPVPMEIDYDCGLVWNLCGVDASNFEFKHGEIINRETGMAAGCLHFNGPAKTDGMAEPVLKHLNLR